MAAQHRGSRFRARYKVVGPKTITQKYTHCWMDETTKSLMQETKEREIESYMVYFPQGHSIRVGKDELVRLGLHVKPRVVDMETGDVVEFGGDLMDFDKPLEDNEDIVLMDEDDEDQLMTKAASKSSKTTKGE